MDGKYLVVNYSVIILWLTLMVVFVGVVNCYFGNHIWNLGRPNTCYKMPCDFMYGVTQIAKYLL